MPSFRVKTASTFSWFRMPFSPTTRDSRRKVKTKNFRDFEPGSVAYRTLQTATTMLKSDQWRLVIFVGIVWDAVLVETTGVFLPQVRDSVCRSLACQDKADEVRNSLNLSANPCDDFYAFTCGNYIKNHAPEAMYFIDSIAPKVKRVKLEMLNSSTPSESDAEATAKKIFEQCIDDEEREKAGIKPLLATLDELIGGWPLLKTNWSTNATLKSIFTAAYYSQDPILIKINVDNSLFNVSQFMIELGEPTELYSRETLESEQEDGRYTKDYINWVTEVASKLVKDTNATVNISSPEFLRDVTNIVDFGRTIILAKKTMQQKQDMTDRRAATTLGALQKKRSFQSSLLSNLTDLMQTLFARANLSHLITDDTPVVDISPQYLQKVDEKLRAIESAGAEGKRRLADYIGWKIITGNRNYLPKRYRTRNSREPKRECMNFITSTMQEVINAVYGRRLNAGKIVEKGTTFLIHLQSSLSNLLNETAWFDNNTRQYALEKVVNIQAIIGFMSGPGIRKRIDDRYKNLTVRSSFFETLQATREDARLWNLAKLSRPFRRDNPLDNVYDTTAINAFYESTTNTLVVPLAILQSPMFHPDFPEAILFGSSGFTVGHEFTHAFDTRGSEFGKKGGLLSWWTNETWSTYKKRSQTLVDQYNKYSIDVGSVNGQQTVIENIADNGGLKVAYKAFRKAVKSANETRSLPGLEQFTPEQLFFIATGTTWCEARTSDAYRLKLLNSDHAVAKFRIIGTMSNMPEFAEAFKCPVGSKMNPEKKNGVW